MAMQLFAEDDFVWADNSWLTMTGGTGSTYSYGDLNTGINWYDWVFLEIGGNDYGVSSGFSDNFDMFGLEMEDNTHLYLAD